MWYGIEFILVEEWLDFVKDVIGLFVKIVEYGSYLFKRVAKIWR